MDLLGDIGATDQLTSARAEINVLQQKVKELTGRIKELNVENTALKIENESLKAEVEIYRNEAATTATNASDANNTTATNAAVVSPTVDDFIRSGNGEYPKAASLTIHKLHGNANPLCCTLSHDDTILATGGADSYLSLLQWERAVDNDNKFIEASDCINYCCRIRCDAPIIACQFSPLTNNRILAMGCMDGSVNVVRYELSAFGKTIVNPTATTTINEDTQPDAIMISAGKHNKYVKTIAWSIKEPTMFASASTDGTVCIYKTKVDYFKSPPLSVEKVETLHLSGPVESICFVQDTLCCYARGTPYLSYFDLSKDFEQTKIHLNQKTTTNSSANKLIPQAAGVDDFVSFCVMDMMPSPSTYTTTAENNKSKYYLILATDTSRQILLDFASGTILKNLYGHDNDNYSQPKIGWSHNGQYILGNSQHDSTVCVWDLASCSIVEKLQQTTTEDAHPHVQTIRDLYCSPYSNTMVTTSFDKMTKVWVYPTTT